jgi:hypothetical protein
MPYRHFSFRCSRQADTECEEPRHVHVFGRDGGEVLEQRAAEVEVHAVRLARQLAQVRAVLDVGFLTRRAVALGCAAALALRLRGRAGAQLVGVSLVLGHRKPPAPKEARITNYSYTISRTICADLIA